MTATVVVAAAAVVTAGVIFSVMVIMVVTLRIGIKSKAARGEGFCRLIRIAADTAAKPDAGLGKGCLGTAADAAADQHVCVQGGQNTGQSAVTAALSIHHFG